MSVAIITGASSGIGREFAHQLLRAGRADSFWLIARRADRMEELAAELGCPCRILPADLTTEEGLQIVYRALEEERPQVGYLVNAAGFGKFGRYDQVSERDVSRMIDLNVKALVLLTHRILPYMERGGHIIQMGSGSCFTPLPAFNVYASSKAFVMHYSKALRYEAKPLGVTVTLFCPGWVHTEFLDLADLHEKVDHPRATKPLLQVEPVVAYALHRAARGKFFAVTNWYTKLQHLLFKLLPDSLLSRTWLGMLETYR